MSGPTSLGKAALLAGVMARAGHIDWHLTMVALTEPVVALMLWTRLAERLAKADRIDVTQAVILMIACSALAFVIAFGIALAWGTLRLI